MGTRAITGPVTAGLMLAVLATAPGHAAHARHQPVLAPWRPSLAVRFSGAMMSLHQPVSSAGDHNGFVTLTVAGVDPARLGALSSAAARAADRVSHSCRCRLSGYEVLARVPGRGVQVVASSTSSG
ncbi:MAG: hypothetical protein E6J45_14675 [Chloroflexi bacterium]|nr:MAG: hypothetical protein E6J45_14675 [Chloroflexota bacterium]